MKKPHIFLIDDQIEVLSTLRHDLLAFQKYFILDDCESADEAMELLEEFDAEGEVTALILSDHRMPNKTGVECFTELSKEERFEGIKKVLITGQASHEDTIEAINNASIDHYISKPWTQKELHRVLKMLLTQWILEQDLEHQDFREVIHPETLLKGLRHKN